MTHQKQDKGKRNQEEEGGESKILLKERKSMHSGFLGVNNWARDFCTKSQFHSSKTGKMDEL